MRISQLHTELANLNASLTALPERELGQPNPLSENDSRPEMGWTYGVGDTLELVDSLNRVTFGQARPIQVEPDGKALFPEVGWIAVAGRSRAELEVQLQELYESLYAEIKPRVVLIERRR